MAFFLPPCRMNPNPCLNRSSVFKASVAYGYIPHAWRISKVVIIPKCDCSNHMNGYIDPSVSHIFFEVCRENSGKVHQERGTLWCATSTCLSTKSFLESRLYQAVGRIEDVSERENVLRAFIEIDWECFR